MAAVFLVMTEFISYAFKYVKGSYNNKLLEVALFKSFQPYVFVFLFSILPKSHGTLSFLGPAGPEIRRCLEDWCDGTQC